MHQRLVVIDTGGPEFPVDRFDSERLAHELAAAGLDVDFVSCRRRRVSRRRMRRSDHGALGSAMRAVLEELLVQLRACSACWRGRRSDVRLIWTSPSIPPIALLLGRRVIRVSYARVLAAMDGYADIHVPARSRIATFVRESVGRGVDGRRQVTHHAFRFKEEPRGLAFAPEKEAARKEIAILEAPERIAASIIVARVLKSE